MSDKDKKQVIRKPWGLTYFPNNKIYSLSKMYVVQTKIRYGNLNFKEEDIPQLARCLVKLSKFKSEFQKAKKELKENEKTT